MTWKVDFYLVQTKTYWHREIMEVQGRKAAAAICTIGLQLQLNVFIYNSQ